MKLTTAIMTGALLTVAVAAQTTMNIHTKSGVQKIAVDQIDSVTFAINSDIPRTDIDGSWKFSYMFETADSVGTVMTQNDLAMYATDFYYQFSSATGAVKTVVVNNGVSEVNEGKYSLSGDKIVFYTDSSSDTGTYTLKGNTLRIEMGTDMVAMTRYYGTIPGLTTRAVSDRPRGFFIPLR